MGHSVTSPSGADRFFVCPGSVQAQAKIDVVEPSNPAALEGLAIHELGSKCLTEDKDPYDCIGETIEVKDNYQEVIEYTVNDDFAFAVRMYRNTILSILKEHNLDQKALQVEAKFKVPEVDPNAMGTTDCSFIAGDTLYVIDLKGGRGVIVDPEENKQCMYYALRPYLDAKMFIARVVILIIQPRAREGDFVKRWETTPQRLGKFVDELKRAIALTKVANPDLKAGDHCHWCKAQGTCMIMQDTIVNQIQTVAPGIESVFPRVSDLTPEQIGNALPALEVLKGFVETLQGYAFTLAMKGQEVPNYTLTRGKKNRQFKDEQAVMDAFEGRDIYTLPKLRSPAQIEKVVGKKELNDYVYVPEGELKLVPTKEAKEFISRKVADVFKDVKIEGGDV